MTESEEWDYLEFVDDLAHIVNHPDLTDMQKLESLTMMSYKPHVFRLG